MMTIFRNDRTFGFTPTHHTQLLFAGPKLPTKSMRQLCTWFLNKLLPLIMWVIGVASDLHRVSGLDVAVRETILMCLTGWYRKYGSWLFDMPMFQLWSNRVWHPLLVWSHQLGMAAPCFVSCATTSSISMACMKYMKWAALAGGHLILWLLPLVALCQCWHSNMDGLVINTWVGVTMMGEWDKIRSGHQETLWWCAFHLIMLFCIEVAIYARKSRL